MHDLAAQGFEVHALSLRGHGEAPPPTCLVLGQARLR
jgi:alpha-beta hydrolase superfamily lysophospholipase